VLFSEACERNKGPLLAVLERWLPRPARVLEVGAGSGQHAVHFTQRLHQVHWHPTELEHNVTALQQRINQEGASRPAQGSQLVDATPLDVAAGPWPEGPYDAVFSANTAHIMTLEAVGQLLAGAARILGQGGLLFLYGPFSDAGEHTAPSNELFDAQLRGIDPAMGVRDADWIRAQAAGLQLLPIADVVMPANNRTLIFQRPPHP
jgi:cyclopropane fatty-acyl-phospholipid synthase-like methyltransferase